MTPRCPAHLRVMNHHSGVNQTGTFCNKVYKRTIRSIVCSVHKWVNMSTVIFEQGTRVSVFMFRIGSYSVCKCNIEVTNLGIN